MIILFQRKSLAHGTTTACYFGTMYLESTEVLVDIIGKLGQRAYVGKINMQHLAPDDYVETHEESIQRTREFIQYVSDKKVRYITIH